MKFWSYSTNLMGPAALHWYENNNIPYTEITKFSKLFNKEVTYKNYEQYAGGRIDAYCSDITDKDYDPYGVNLNLPIMKAESYGRFSEWLMKFKSERLYSFEELRASFEKTNNKLEIFEEKEKQNGKT